MSVRFLAIVMIVCGAMSWQSATDIGFALIHSAEAQETIPAAEGLKKVAAGALLVDVRSPSEFASGHAAGAINIPHDQVPMRLAEFGEDKHREIVLYCRTGVRSGLAQRMLLNAGYTRTYNAGGFDEWEKAVVAHSPAAPTVP